MTIFDQIQRVEGLPAMIARQIYEKVAQGLLKAGDRLPTESELSESFGVSRTVVREAIAQLRHEGLVETRRGVGAFITEPERRQFLRLDDLSLNDPESFRSLFQLRSVLEVEAAGLAAQHHTEEEMVRIDDALNRMIHADKWSDDGVVADLDFHHEVASATGNEYFPLFIGFISEKMHQAMNTSRTYYERDEIVKITIDEHVAVRDAIAKRDVEGARKAMEAHILGGAQRVKLQAEDKAALYKPRGEL
ncbi:FadR/GntR family transcriptional regulator [Paenalcaligenes sp. Me131]|uniref:FadR/GntR family transcriptional regulator n=1 Tax=Paenalcaligenes sp. Me131 TaxID=3392636 RepID=UPI003D29A611